MSKLVLTQVNEFQILFNQAKLHESRNQFAQAMEIYESLYNNYPAEENLVESILRICYINNDLEKASSYLFQSESILNPFFMTKQKIIFYLKSGKVKEADKLATDWINKNPGGMNYYRELASVFENESLFDPAIKIYLKARNLARDDNLYAYELSTAYYFIKEIELCFLESLKNLRLNPGYLYVYKSRFSDLVKNNPDHVKFLEKYLQEKEPEQVYEVYAFCLVEIQLWEKATKVYEKLPLAKLIVFGDDLLAGNHVEYALETYERALMSTDNSITKADVEFKIAQIYFDLHKFEQCITVLSSIIANEEIQLPTNRHRTRANVASRLMMALLSIKENAAIMQTQKWFEEASTFSVNNKEKAEILFQLARYLYLQEDYQQAESIIQKAISGQDQFSDIVKNSYFYRYEIALFQNDAQKDSLLTECIIYNSQDPRLTDMLFVETFINTLSQKNTSLSEASISTKNEKTFSSAHAQFLQALRYKGLYQDSLAVVTLLNKNESQPREELLLLAYDWGYKSGVYELVKYLENYNFKNHVFQDYIFLQNVRKAEAQDEKINLISNFLNNNPQNVFSPQLRTIIFNHKLKEAL